MLMIQIFKVSALIQIWLAGIAAQDPGDIQLYRGTSTSGIVQLYHETSGWATLCGNDFTDKEAHVACTQLGFKNGTALPLSAYGHLVNGVVYPEKLSSCATGEEVKLTDCSFEGETVCPQIDFTYASVNCYNVEAAIPDSDVSLDKGSGEDAGYFSAVSVYRHGMWGHVCTEFWDDSDANVTCKQLGYAGGVASLAESDWTKPILITEINCEGSMQALTECETKPELCNTGRVAGVVCNKKQAAEISLVGGKKNYGKVVISVDGVQGLFCQADQDDWRTNAYVVCTTLGYIGGYGYTTGNPDKKRMDDFYHILKTPGIDTVVLDMTCDNSDESVFGCRNNGWNNVSESCSNSSMAAAVYCYSSVYLSRYKHLETYEEHTGQIRMKINDTLNGICADTFTKIAANIACQHDLGGFPVAEILMPGSYGDISPPTRYVNSLLCQGTETSLQECVLSTGRCKNHSRAAAVLCKVLNLSDDYQFELKNTGYGEIIMSRFGVAGTICRSGWDNKDAAVMCKASGNFVDGVAMAASRLYGRISPAWASEFACTGTENSLNDCTFQSDLSADWSCSDNFVPAGALCYSTEPPVTKVRLGHRKSSYQGRAEVYTGESSTGWATICNIGWSNYDAKVFCRELGFADGQPDSNAFTARADNDVKIAFSDMECEGTESSIFQCPNLGYQKYSFQCANHFRDAGVYCYTYVSLSLQSNYGAVLYHSGESYGLVCADGFDANAAKVVCKEIGGYSFGKPLCCSAFGPQTKAFTLSEVKCTGSESSLMDCQHSAQNQTCPSGHYASVVCTNYEGPYINIKANPVVEISNYTHDGLVCSENFTHEDAKVVCKETANLIYGRAFKSSAKDLTHRIRWLRGLGCKGTETSIRYCGPHNLGQIGVCSWDSVAAVICSNNQGDMDFDLRLVNGTSIAGRLEVKIKGTWGSVCGTDLTRSEAKAVCKHLGYHDGIVKEPGYYGRATGPVHLSGIKCNGNESSIEDCVWSGYGSASSFCDHSSDAAIFCSNRIRLSGSTTVNYGRLEVFDDDENDWVLVCDRNRNVANANILCGQLGYKDGMFQRGSPLGSTTRKLLITNINCDDPTKCTFSKGTCSVDKYVALYCSDTSISSENLAIRLPLSSYYGPVSVRRFGLWGHICSEGFDDTDASVVCIQLGFVSGYALKTYATSGFPIIQGKVDCSTGDSTLTSCSRGVFAEDHGCFAINTVAAVLCYNNQVTFGYNALNHDTGKMTTALEVLADDNSFHVGMSLFTDTDAAVYCTNLGYAGGEINSPGYGAYGVTDISCVGTEDSILQCPGVWDPSRHTGREADLARVICFTAVRLEGGVPGTYGAVYTSKGVNNGPVCASGFDENDADVACRSLGHDSGLVLCCAPVGQIEGEPVMTNVRCTGSEKQFTDCDHDTPAQTEACGKNYAAVACYTGPKLTDYTLNLTKPDSYAGNLILTYLGIEGSICMDGWDGNDASVACRELGYKRGMAYHAARSTSGPYWTSDVKCTGSEKRLGECPLIKFGKVTRCTNGLSHAGVICYDNEGVFYRLEGSGEPRYGNVVITLNGEWRSLCNLHWENADAHVLCTMLGFRTGEVYNKVLNVTLDGPVWEANFQCDGSEGMLNNCLSSGWRISTTSACALHQKDAGAFCYTSVKLSTGAGRDTSSGAVLFYRDGNWYTMCSEDFNDTSAKVACRELGFIDGQTQISDHGPLLKYPLLNTHKVQCSGNETDVTDCLVEETCNSNVYASVVCYGFLIQTTEAPTKSPVVEKQVDTIAVVIVVLVFIILIIIAVIAICFYIKRRRQKKLEASKLNFDNTIVSEHHDGAFIATNPLANLAPTPEVPRVQYTNQGGNQTTRVLSPLYDNPGYSYLDRDGDGEVINESNPYSVIQQPGANRTVIQVASGSQKHDYDEVADVMPQSETSDKPTVTDDRHYMSMSLSYQKELPSPLSNTSEKPPVVDDGHYMKMSLSDKKELSSQTSNTKEPN